MKVVFRTNIDEAQGDVGEIGALWPDGHVPRVGEHIQLRGYQLRVVSVDYASTLVSRDGVPTGNAQYRASVELHAPSWFTGTLGELIEWVKRCRKNVRSR